MIKWFKKFWCNNYHMWHTITWTITTKFEVKTLEVAVCWDCGRQFKNGVER